jgi:hypothetical protein
VCFAKIWYYTTVSNDQYTPPGYKRQTCQRDQALLMTPKFEAINHSSRRPPIYCRREVFSSRNGSSVQFTIMHRRYFMLIPEVVLAHELDAAWIIALWKAIHGGDPSPEAVAAEAIAALAQYLSGAEYSFTFAQMEKQFANLGIKVTERTADAGAQGNNAKPNAPATREIQQPGYHQYRQYCFQVNGKTVCAQLPEVALRLEAA